MPDRLATLTEFLLDGTEDPLAVELAEWLDGSPRFLAFAEAHRAKIRKKLRGATDPEARRDVRAELRCAHLLLGDRRIELAFEAYGSGNPGPDFTVTRGSERLNLEVTRLRGAPGDVGYNGLLAKLRQLPPSAANAVVLAIEGVDADAYDITAAVRVLRTRADAKDEAFFAARGFDGTRGFYERFLRLGAVIVWADDGVGAARASVWTNPSARIAPPARAMRACGACLRAG